ncbi:hypothetical protein [Nannocystis pusilla]|uniref:PD-(D/E)XK nuclease family protein n=1 Tax=Nannocystis pusilla TaxID=889268 RepID=A0ABS7TXM5_9BACT|nr:hypothetical protein [Nannocystis pusilla]MBZ5712985.1 hypothetical protein [Nannocystis pusilla]
MRRRLDRLFSFARAVENCALENFTTEALADAVERDPGPLLRALPREVAHLAAFREARVGRVDTQVRVPGGIVDLVVELVVDGVPLHLWIEVKAHAGLSGDQLQAYRAAAGRWPSAPLPIVFMLCKYPLTRDVPTLRWNTLRACVTADCHHYWLELRDFLEDHRMADEFDAPFTVAQLGAAGHARALLCKATRLAREFLDRPDLPASWFESNFPRSEARLTRAIVGQFVRHNRLVVDSRRYPWVCFGIYFRDSPELTLWIEFRPDDRAAYDAIGALAPGLPKGWIVDWNPVSPWIGASQALAGDLEHETAMAWLFERVRELEAAKILAALPRWRRHERLGDDETD